MGDKKHNLVVTLNVTLLKESPENSFHIAYLLTDDDINENELYHHIKAMSRKLIQAEDIEKNGKTNHGGTKEASKKRIWPSWRKKIPDGR